MSKMRSLFLVLVCFLVLAGALLESLLPGCQDEAVVKIAVEASVVVTTDASSSQVGGHSTLGIVNNTAADTTVYVAFGSDSVINSSSWPQCGSDGATLNCDFALSAQSSVSLPLAGQYCNATFSFGAAVGCDTTKAEVNLNNPSWYDIADVSLVDGYSNDIAITAIDRVDSYDAGAATLGPPLGSTGNEEVFGLYPLGCDLCVATSSNSSCGFPAGNAGCKTGTQYNPTVPCQWQGTVLGGGTAVVVSLEN